MWGFSTEEVKLLNELDPGVQWHPTNSSYLSVRISNTKADRMSALHLFSLNNSECMQGIVNVLPLCLSVRCVSQGLLPQNDS